MIENVLELAFALCGQFLFAMVFGTALDNQARQLDPSTPYHSKSTKAR